ncbi:acetyl-CoA C-acetyltransferase [Micromonospora viridifaciens]|uniref:Acetyl-CoA C-acetyltransferase n=1 Tax=Micromonospora viridifaciens TaxID=1881 RepID=A0A1C4YVU7_MICVI|nr:acetyl-CoA acetyltransferase [Micromonospora viridifaciens]SCF24737.1 acetyl-CoA C-acetyltransferase [Micromonospora viridifaciens]
MPISNQVAVVGTGVTRFGELYDRSYLSLLHEAATAAADDAGVEVGALEAAWLGTAEPQLGALVGDSAAAVTEALGFAPRPVTRVANFCATGMEAVRAAALAVAAGEYEVVLAVGAEKMRDLAPRESLVAKAVEQSHPVIAKGRTAPGQFALVASRYLHTYGYGRDVLAAVAVKNHQHATNNPKAHYRTPLTVEQVLSAPMAAEPLGLLDCTPTTDGAAAVVLASRRWAERNARQWVLIQGIGVGSYAGYYPALFRRDNDFLGFAATRAAAASAYRQAGITDPRAQLDLVECHDCFTITEIVNTEDLGLFASGTGGAELLAGTTTLGGELPVNVSGGLQSCGHPVGATGVRMVAEVTDQILGRAGSRQVRGARRGLAHNLGGPGAVAAVTVLGAA